MDSALQQLKDIHLPSAIKMWPIAPGWLILFILLIVSLSLLIYFYFRNQQQKYTVKFALAKLSKLQALMQTNPDNINIAAEVSTLLRRTALYYFPREEIAGLTGSAWLQFLNRTGNTSHFTQETAHLLTNAPYQKENISNTLNLTPLFSIAREWLHALHKQHKKRAASRANARDPV